MTVEAKILKLLNLSQAVIDLGDVDGVYEGQKYIVYELGDMIKDPESGKDLERLEHIKAKVKIIQVQKKISVVEGYRTERFETEISTTLIRYPAVRFRDSIIPIVDEDNPENPTNVKEGDKIKEIT
jgi:hypothetical protein